MKRRTGLSRPELLGVFAALLFRCHAAIAAPVQDVLDIDLSPLIDQSARYPTRFAVDLPHPVSTADGGTWTQSGGDSTWTYSIRIPTAVSLSFHADRASFPAGAVLKVTGANGASATYRARDIARSGLWSRPLPGDSLLLSLTVDTAARPQTVLQVESFQAGYRSLGAGVPDNAHYRSLMRKTTQTSSCTVNYACEANSANQGPGGATVAIVVSGVVQCTGTLLNDTSNDGTPYVLTARHCENGVLGGGDPGAAANVTVYWDAVTPCGSALGSIYDGNATTQTGATTVVEQQDAWLIRLDAPPAANDAYYAGWDATGGVFSGGYSIHHALGNDKQYVAWYGQPILQTISGATLQLDYASTFWGVVNSVGSVGAGASGGALFDPNNHAVGSATLAQLVSGPNTAGVCPLASPPTPSPATVTAMYTALSAVWSSDADTSSSTGTVTLQSVLDAANTGKLVNGGIGSLPIAFTVNQTSASTGEAVSLTWSAPGAQSCTASGGLSGDGWEGSMGASGTIALTEQTGGEVAYGIRCTGASQVGSASVSIDWQFVPASVNITGSGPTAAAGREVLLQWSANVQPCTASGGISGDGWAGTKASNGSQSVLASVIGSVTYTLTCGTGARTASNQYSITVVAPSVGTISNDANDLIAGQAVNLQFGAGGSCVASGGADGDGWAGPLATSSADSGPLSYTQSVTEAVAGTYTYTVTCSGAGATAGLSATSSVTLTFTNATPVVAVSISPSSAEVYTDPGATAANSDVNLSWTSNVRPCEVSAVGPGNTQYTAPGGMAPLPTDTLVESEAVAGAYTYTVTCGSGPNQAQGSASATYYTNAPAVTLNVPSVLPLGVPATVSWVYNVYPCTGTGGQGGDGWSGGPKAANFAGIVYQTVTESATGAVTFGITCGSGAQTAQAQATATVVAPQVSITATPSSLPVNGVAELTWSSNLGFCTSSITPGGAGGWGNPQPTGSLQISATVAGTYTYAIDCQGVQASTQVTFTGSLVTLTASPSSAAVDTPVTLTWNSPPGTESCLASGGSTGDGWTGSLGASGTQTVTETIASTVTYSISCNFGAGPVQAQTQVTYTPVTATDPATPTPQVTVSASAASQVVGSPVTIRWSSQNASACTASGGSNDDGWSGNLALSGSMPITESTAGSYYYGVMCTGAPPAASASAEVNFTDRSTETGGSGKSGGGGALDPLSLVLLGLVACASMRRRRSDRDELRRNF
jgi:lysyl endopeptidase